MKFFAVFLLFALYLTSCSGIRQIGSLNMVANRNVDPSNEYVLLRSYAGSSTIKEIKSELKYEKATSLEAAINKTVKNTPGGEYLTNVTIYHIRYKYYVVQGDVYGLANQEPQYKGWKTGDYVQFRKGKLRSGTIIDLKNSEVATIKEKYTGKIFNIPYLYINRDFDNTPAPTTVAEKEN